MIYIKIIAIIAAALAIFLSYDLYKKGSMSARALKIICTCEGAALIGTLCLTFFG